MKDTNASRKRSLKGEFKGIKLQRSATGALTVDVSALDRLDVTVITGGAVTLRAPGEQGGVTLVTTWEADVRSRTPAREQANATDAPRASVDSRAYVFSYVIGDVLPDGWIVGPVSPDTGIVMSIEPVAGALDGYKTWHQGEIRAAELRGKGNANARQPSENELNALYNDVVKAGRNSNAQFNTSGSDPFGNYWSSTAHPDGRDVARLQYFGDGGYWDWHFKDYAIARVRCVRDEPKLSL